MKASTKQVTIETGEVIKTAKKLTANLTIPEVVNQVQADNAGTQIGAAKKAKKQLEEKRLKITRPIDEAKREVMDLFRPYIDALDKYINGTNTALAAYRKKLLLQQQEQERKLREQQEKERAALEARQQAAKRDSTKERLQEEIETIENTVAPVVPVQNTAGGHFMKVYKWRYAKKYDANNIALKKEILDKYPHLIKIDEAGLTAFGKQTKGQAPINGIEFYFDSTFVSK